MRIERRKVEMRRYRLVLQREDDLDQAGDSRRGFQVAEICFHRAERTGPVLRSRLAEYGGQCLDLDGIAQRRAGPVGLDVIDLAWIDAAVIERLAHDCLLRQAVGSGEAVRAAVLIDRRCRVRRRESDRRRPGRSASRLSTTTPQPSPRTKPSARAVECFAAAVRRHHAELGESDRHLRREDQIHAASDDEVAFFAAQALTARDERRRATTSRRYPPRGWAPADQRNKRAG